MPPSLLWPLAKAQEFACVLCPFGRICSNGIRDPFFRIRDAELAGQEFGEQGVS